MDRVLHGEAHNAFCAVRPPGHHAGVELHCMGAVSNGFCILNNVALAALYAHHYGYVFFRFALVISLVFLSLPPLVSLSSSVMFYFPLPALHLCLALCCCSFSTRVYFSLLLFSIPSSRLDLCLCCFIRFFLCSPSFLVVRLCLCLCFYCFFFVVSPFFLLPSLLLSINAPPLPLNKKQCRVSVMSSNPTELGAVMGVECRCSKLGRVSPCTWLPLYCIQ